MANPLRPASFRRPLAFVCVVCVAAFAVALAGVGCVANPTTPEPDAENDALPHDGYFPKGDPRHPAGLGEVPENFAFAAQPLIAEDPSAAADRFAILVGAGDYADARFNVPGMAGMIEAWRAGLATHLRMPNSNIYTVAAGSVSAEHVAATVQALAPRIPANPAPGEIRDVAAPKPVVVVVWLGGAITDDEGRLLLFTHLTRFDGRHFSPTISARALGDLLAPLTENAHVVTVIEPWRVPGLDAVAGGAMELAGTVTAYASGTRPLLAPPTQGRLPQFSTEVLAGLSAVASAESFDWLALLREAETRTRAKNPAQTPGHVADKAAVPMWPIPRVALTVRVTGPTGMLLANALADANIAGHPAKLISPGVFEFPDLREGQYVVTASADGFVPRSIAVTIAAQSPRRLALQTYLVPTFIEIYGVVYVDAARMGAPPASTPVVVIADVAGSFIGSFVAGFHSGTRGSPVTTHSGMYSLRVPPTSGTITVHASVAANPAANGFAALDLATATFQELSVYPDDVSANRATYRRYNAPPIALSSGTNGEWCGTDELVEQNGESLQPLEKALFEPDDFAFSMLLAGATSAGNGLGKTLFRADLTLDMQWPHKPDHVERRFGLRWHLGGAAVPALDTGWGQIGVGLQKTFGTETEDDTANLFFSIDAGVMFRFGSFLGLDRAGFMPTLGLSLPAILYFDDEDSGLFLLPALRVFYADDLRTPAHKPWLAEFRFDVGWFFRPMALALSIQHDTTRPTSSTWVGVSVSLLGWPFRRFGDNGHEQETNDFLDEDAWDEPAEDSGFLLGAGYIFRSMSMTISETGGTTRHLAVTAHGELFTLGAIINEDGFSAVVAIDFALGKVTTPVAMRGRDYLYFAFFAQFNFHLGDSVYATLRLHSPLNAVIDEFALASPITDLAAGLSVMTQRFEFYLTGNIGFAFGTVSATKETITGSVVGLMMGGRVRFD